jgi:ArsR family transcriptional regulator
MNNNSYVRKKENMSEKLQKCAGEHHHTDLVDNITANMPDESILCDLAEFFKVFADSTRIKILYALSARELCVCDIWQSLGLTQSAVSHQLRILKQMRLVKYRKEGKTIYYSLDDAHIQSILDGGLEHVME